MQAYVDCLAIPIMQVFRVPHLGGSLLRRIVLLWVTLRSLIVAGSLVTARMPSALRWPDLVLPVPSTLIFTAFVTTLVWISLRRNNEDLFLLCLGMDRGQVMGAIVLLMAALEAGLRILVRIVA